MAALQLCVIHQIRKLTKTKTLIESAQLPAGSITQAITNVYASWVGIGQFNTRLDFAIRNWARRSGTVRRARDYLFCISGQRPSDADVQRLQNLRD